MVTQKDASDVLFYLYLFTQTLVEHLKHFTMATMTLFSALVVCSSE